MKKFEYKEESIHECDDLVKFLNKEGSKGWEVVDLKKTKRRKDGQGGTRPQMEGCYAIVFKRVAK